MNWKYKNALCNFSLVAEGDFYYVLFTNSITQLFPFLRAAWILSKEKYFYILSS